MCGKRIWGQYIDPFVYTDSEWTGQYSVPFGVFVLFFRCGQDNVLFVLCGNAGKCTGNADNIGYGNGIYVWRIDGTGTLIWYVNDVCVGRIGGKRTELWNPIPGIPLLFRYYLSGRATIAKGSGNVPLSKFARIACGYAEKSGNDTGMSGTFWRRRLR